MGFSADPEASICPQCGSGFMLYHFLKFFYIFVFLQEK